MSQVNHRAGPYEGNGGMQDVRPRNSLSFFGLKYHCENFLDMVTTAFSWQLYLTCKGLLEGEIQKVAKVWTSPGILVGEGEHEKSHFLSELRKSWPKADLACDVI